MLWITAGIYLSWQNFLFLNISPIFSLFFKNVWCKTEFDFADTYYNYREYMYRRYVTLFLHFSMRRSTLLNGSPAGLKPVGYGKNVLKYGRQGNKHTNKKYLVSVFIDCVDLTDIHFIHISYFYLRSSTCKKKAIIFSLLTSDLFKTVILLKNIVQFHSQGFFV